MDAKQSLNNTQRKVLQDVYLERLKNRRKEYQLARNIEGEKYQKTLTEEAKKVAEPLFKKLKELEDLAEKNKELIESYGINVSVGYSGYRRLDKGVINMTADTHSPKFDEFKEETMKELDKFDAAELEIKAKVWGVDVSYTDLDEDITKVIEGLGN